jgi:putative ABC transport system permease protein
VDTLWHDLRFGVRLLTRSPGFTAVVVATLALGIGANSALFSVVNAVLLRPLPFADPQRVMTLWEANARQGVSRSEVSAASFVDWRRESRAFDRIAAFRPWGFVLTGKQEPARVRGARVSARLFPLLGVRPILGRAFLEEEDRFGAPRVVLLGHALWQERFGADPSVVGRTVRLNDEPHTIVGVLPPGLPLPDAELSVPLQLEPYAMTQRGNRSLTVLGRLTAGITLAQAQAELNAIAARIAGREPSNAGWGVAVVPLHEHMVGRIRPTLFVLWGAVGAVLLIACANVAHLLLQRTTARRHEVAVRAALGAGRARLVRQLVTESVVLSLPSGALGLLLAGWGTNVMTALAPSVLPRANETAADPDVALFTVGLALLTGIAFGLFPAWHAASGDPHETLKEGRTAFAAGASRARFRSVIVAVESMLALVVLVAAGLLLRSFVRVRGVDLGFDAARELTMTISLPDSRYPQAHQRAAFFGEVLERVRGIPGVEAAGMVSHLPLAPGALRTDFTVAGRLRAPGEVPTADYVNCNPDYFRALAIPLRKGRAFTLLDGPSTPPVAIVNDAFARRYWPTEEPLGQRIVVGAALGANPAPRTVVGVVGDIRSRGLDAEAQPAIYVPYAQNPWPTMTLVARTAADPMTVAAAVRSQVQALDPAQAVYNERSMEQVLFRSLAARRFPALLVTLFALVASALAALGVYAVISYGVALRSHELGVRMALGAEPRDVLGLVVGGALRSAAIGTALGCAAAAGLTRLFETMLFGVTPLDAVTFAGAASFLLVTAFLAGYLPARRAMRIDPVAAFSTTVS